MPCDSRTDASCDPPCDPPWEPIRPHGGGWLCALNGFFCWASKRCCLRCRAACLLSSIKTPLSSLVGALCCPTPACIPFRVWGLGHAQACYNYPVEKLEPVQRQTTWEYDCQHLAIIHLAPLHTEIDGDHLKAGNRCMLLRTAAYC